MAAEVQKNVAIFDDFISSNNTNDDFDEITATLGDVDAYIEHQQKMKSERGGKRGGRGGKGGKGGDGGDQGGEGGPGGRGGGEGGKRGGRGGGEAGGRGGGEGGGRGGGEGGRGGRGGGESGGRGGGEGGRGGRGGGEGGKRGGGRGGGEAGQGEGGKRGGGGGRGGGEGGRGGRGGGKQGGGGPGEAELRHRDNVGPPVDEIDRLKREAHRLDQGGELHEGPRADGDGPRGDGTKKGKRGKGGRGGKGGKGGRGGKAEASLKGVLIMLAGTFCMSGSIMTMKLASKVAPIVQVRFLRSLICLGLAAVYAKSFKGMSLKLSEIENKKSLLMRVGMTVFQTFAQLYVARKLPLGLTAALMGMSPVTQSVLNWLILKTTMDMKQWTCIITSVIGVFLISQPDFLFGSGDINQFEEFDKERYIAIGLAITMNVLRALTMILNRKMMMEGEGRLHFSQFTFYNNIVATVLCIALLPFKGNVGYKIMELPGWDAIGLIALGALMFFGRPLLMEVGQGSRLPASMITILRTSSIVWAFTFQLVLFGEIPSYMETAGISIIVGCASMMFQLTGNE